MNDEDFSEVGRENSLILFLAAIQICLLTIRVGRRNMLREDHLTKSCRDQQRKELGMERIDPVFIKLKCTGSELVTIFMSSGEKNVRKKLSKIHI